MTEVLMRRITIGLIITLLTAGIVAHAQEPVVAETLFLNVTRSSPTAATFSVASGATLSVTFQISNDSTAADAERKMSGSYTLAYTSLTLHSGPATSGPFTNLAKNSPISATWTFQAPTGPASGSITLSASLTSINPHRAWPTGGDKTTDSKDYSVNVLAPSLPPPTTTTVSCVPNPINVGYSSTCTASVTGGTTIPQGTVLFASSKAGTFAPNPCTLNAGGACSTTSTPSEVGVHTITGTYTPSSYHGASFGTTTLGVSDPTPPVITPSVVGTVGSNGWYTSNVAVSWTVTDPESQITYKSDACDVTTNITTDTHGVTVTCTATSAGGTSSQSVIIKRDATPPNLTGTRSPDPNAAGWNKTDVTVSFVCTDATSGVATPPATPQVVSEEGKNLSRSATCTDYAGLSASLTINGINIDKTPPTIAITAPANGTTYILNQPMASDYICADPLSGVASCAGPVPSGTNFDTSSVGTKVFTVNATDNAGNTATSISTYYVDYKFVGLLQPYPAPPWTSVPTFKQGSSVPLKWQYADYNGLIDSSGLSPQVFINRVACTSGADQGVIDVDDAGQSGLRYDTLTKMWIYNWQTKGLSPGTCYSISIKPPQAGTAFPINLK
ncbi:MAG: hypothetical protein FJW34_02705 [Acidobacteria bacterium]|nr:hypothetical protein [Acidobacteriota bacterium]